MTAYERADVRMRKITYKGLTDAEKKYIKAEELRRQYEKELDRFYRTAPRINGAVDWDSLDEKTLDCFDHIYKAHEKALAKLSIMEDAGIDGDRAKSIFCQLNTHSASF